MRDFLFTEGSTPLLVSIPHAGTALPDNLAERLSDAAASLPDTDWFVDRLYGFAADLGASVLIAKNSRYVIDLNRGTDDEPLYSGRGTGLVPLETFDGDRVYRDGPPDDEEQRQRIKSYWLPYHQQLENTLQDLRSRHGHAVLLDAHSIRQRVPALFDGVLPDLNLGTNDGHSADSALIGTAYEVLRSSEGFSAVLDARFKGGFITRNYGQPDQGVHALQLEIAQNAYMNENPPSWNDQKAQSLRALLDRLLIVLIHWSPP